MCSINLLMRVYLTVGLYSHVNSHDSGVVVRCMCKPHAYTVVGLLLFGGFCKNYVH